MAATRPTRPTVDRRTGAVRGLVAVVLVLSFLPDVGPLVTDPAATVPAVVVLMAMHVVVATVPVGVLTQAW